MNYIHEKAAERIRKFMRGYTNSHKLNFEFAKRNAVISCEIELEYIDKLQKLQHRSNNIKTGISFDFCYIENLKKEIESYQFKCECNDVKYFDKQNNCLKCH